MMNEVMEVQVQGVNENKENKKKQKMKYTVKDGVATFVDSKGRAFTVDEEDAERVAEYTWCVTDRGYVASGNVEGESTRLHRFIMGLGKEDKDLVVDHIQTGLENRANNCKSNLRICSHQENQRNNNAKGYTKLLNGKYQPYISLEGKKIYLGCYDTEEQAKAIRIQAEQELYKEFSSNGHLFEDQNRLRLVEEALASIEYLHKNKVRLNDEDDVVYVTVSSKGIIKEFVIDLADYEIIKSYKWCANNKGQIVTRVNSGEMQLLARFLMGLEKGDNKRVKFIDGNNLNFRRENLKVVECKTKAKNEESKMI